MMRARLQACRNRFGSAPRSFSDPRTAEYLTIQPPHFVTDHQPKISFYRQILAEQAALCRDGRIVWGYAVQANKLLYKQGDHDHPAAVIYSLDPAMDATPRRLRDIAEAMFALKRMPQADRAHQAIADALGAERVPTVRLPVPVALAGARHVYLTSTIVIRAHLPAGYLRDSLFPLLVDPKRTAANMILPSRFWPEELKRSPWAKKTGPTP